MTRSIIRPRLVVAALASTALLAGCGSSDTSGSTAPKESSAGGLSKAEIYTTGLVNVAEAGEPVSGGTLTVADFGEPRVLNPAVTYANGATGGSAMAAASTAPIARLRCSAIKSPGPARSRRCR